MQFAERQAFSFQILNEARQQALVEMQTYRQQAHWSAIFVSALLTIFGALLMGLIVWRLSDHGFELGFRYLMTGITVHLYFMLMLLFVVSLPTPFQRLIEDFRLVAQEPMVGELASANVGDLERYINKIRVDTTRVPKIYHEKVSMVPEDPRWWSLGWDAVYLIDLHREAMAALLRRSLKAQQQLEKARKYLKQACVPLKI